MTLRYIPTRRLDVLSENTQILLENIKKSNIIVNDAVEDVSLSSVEERLPLSEASQMIDLGFGVFKQASTAVDLGKIWIRQEIIDPVTGKKEDWLVVYTNDDEEVIRQISNLQVGSAAYKNLSYPFPNVHTAAASKYSWVNLEEDFDKEYVSESKNLFRKNKNNQLHSLHSPAIEFANGDKYWCQDDKLHRTDGPASEYANGDKLWYQNGKLHRADSPAIEWANGAKEWYVNDKLHRIDGPAIEKPNGDKEWYVNNELIGKSDNGFTDEDFENWKQENPDKLEVTANLLNKLSWVNLEEDFDKEYIDEDGDLLRKNKNDDLHSLYSPAVEFANGTKYWYKNGNQHRTDGPAIERADGSNEWYQDDKRHRTDGPAIEYANGDKFWYQNGKCHRIDGPAIEKPNGDKAWYVNNELIGRSRDGFTDEDFENWKQENPDKLEVTLSN